MFCIKSCIMRILGPQYNTKLLKMTNKVFDLNYNLVHTDENADSGYLIFVNFLRILFHFLLFILPIVIYVK